MNDTMRMMVVLLIHKTMNDSTGLDQPHNHRGSVPFRFVWDVRRTAWFSSLDANAHAWRQAGGGDSIYF